MTDQSLTETSRVVQLWSRVVGVLGTARETAVVVTIGKLFLQPNPIDDEERVRDTAADAGPGDEYQARSTEPNRSDQRGLGLLHGSRLYALTRRWNQLLASSVVYDVLSGKDNPREIVIDLRKPQVMAAFRRLGLRTYRTATSVVTTSRVAAMVYRRTDKPIRTVSIAVGILTLLALVGDAVSGDSTTASTFVLISILIVAARGTQKTQTWDELTATRWGERFVSPGDRSDESKQR
jgi:hypothetical protein